MLSYFGLNLIYMYLLCIGHINFWILQNVLLFNETKSELINMSHSQSTFPSLSVNNSLI